MALFCISLKHKQIYDKSNDPKFVASVQVHNKSQIPPSSTRRGKQQRRTKFSSHSMFSTISTSCTCSEVNSYCHCKSNQLLCLNPFVDVKVILGEQFVKIYKKKLCTWIKNLCKQRIMPKTTVTVT